MQQDPIKDKLTNLLNESDKAHAQCMCAALDEYKSKNMVAIPKKDGTTEWRELAIPLTETESILWDKALAFAKDIINYKTASIIEARNKTE